ncbi:hypothetical protein DL98DRAFT_647796 [Cadophora sp. DSE1049]|nr:hypothetical protein DL98DRAFT_647796 [Cadophora sp. DSE1049]
MGQNRNTSVAAFTPLSCGWAGCNKEFKRACDLTMHEKTHSRPWKCPDKSCKYHEIGWPTEKELDRHHRDKHDALQPVFKCHYKPCPYQSKRESNCKQHMEKAHGWTYVRSKNKGKVRVAVPVANNGMVYDPEAPLLSYSTSPTIKSSMAGSGIIDNHHAYPSALSPAHNAYAPTPTAHETMGYHPAPVRSTYAIQKDNNDNSRRLL